MGIARKLFNSAGLKRVLKILVEMCAVEGQGREKEVVVLSKLVLRGGGQ